MTRRMTQAEALTYLEMAFNVEPDLITAAHMEACIAGSDPHDAAESLAAYCQSEVMEIDPDSVTFRADRVDDGDMPAVHIIIKTEVVQ